MAQNLLFGIAALKPIEANTMSESITLDYKFIQGRPNQKWHDWIQCPHSSFVKTLTVKQIPKESHAGDNVAVTSLSVNCEGSGSDIEIIDVPHSEVKVPDHLECPSGQTSCGIGVKNENVSVYSQDHVAITNTRLMCCDTSRNPKAHPSDWSTYSEFSGANQTIDATCRPGWYLCGAQAKGMDDHAASDNYGLEGLNIRCCPSNPSVHSYTLGDAAASEKWNASTNCPRGEAIAAVYTKYATDYNPINGDHIGISEMKIKCKSIMNASAPLGGELLVASAHVPSTVPQQDKWSTCPVNTYVCGLGGLFKGKSAGRDSAAFETFEVECCDKSHASLHLYKNGEPETQYDWSSQLPMARCPAQKYICGLTGKAPQYQASGVDNLGLAGLTMECCDPSSEVPSDQGGHVGPVGDAGTVLSDLSSGMSNTAKVGTACGGVLIAGGALTAGMLAHKKKTSVDNTNPNMNIQDLEDDETAHW